MSATHVNAIRHERIMASAGSGKTFQLTNRYLQLIFDDDPASILASTFTRLAAGEIRDRILGRLAEAALSDKACGELGSFIARPGLTRAEAGAVLAAITRQLHRLQVRTLDSFFAGVVRCFSLELGIDPASEVVDEDTERRLRRDAIARLLDERDPQPIIDLLRVLTEGSTQRSVTDDIDSLVKGLYELYRDAPAEAWEAITPAATLTRDQLADAIDRLQGVELQTTHKSIVKAHQNHCHVARSARHDDYHAWLEFLSKGLAAKIVNEDAEFYGVTIAEEVIEAYTPLIDHGRAVLRNSVVHRTRAMRDLLARFHNHYQQVKAAEKALTFSDITWKMAEAESLGSLQDICFRLDATLHHLLLDEMQDTSIAQWRAISPIVQEIISHAPPQRTFFCVGDVKQSIYSWREACPEILESLVDIAVDAEGNPVIAGDRDLYKSYRSSSVIMDAVNAAFADIEKNRAMTDFPVAAARWRDSFKRHETARDLTGYAELRTVRLAGERENQARVRLQEAAALVQQLHQDCPGRSIGVLTRTNKSVNTLLYELGPSRLAVPASGRGGGALTDSAAVNAVLDLLRLADHPEHTIAAFNVLHSPLGRAVGLTDMSMCTRVSREIRRQVLEEGMAMSIQRWVRVIARETDARQFRRLVQLQQLGAEFDQRPTLRCSDFVSMAESRRMDDPSATPVQVMTVHQSKGLEFDIVVLPELDGEIVRGSPIMLYSRDGAAGEINCIARHLDQTVTSMIPELAAMHDAHRQRAARESLCLLYVAMTRARRALHMLIDPPAKRSRNRHFSTLLRDALSQHDFEPEAQLFAIGDSNWHTADAPGSTEPAEAPQELTNIAIAPPRGVTARGRAVASASAEEAEAQPLAAQLHLPHTDARERGTVIHAMFEQIDWLDTWQIDRAHLHAVVRRIVPRRDAQWIDQQIDSFLDMLKHPAVKAALSRGDAGDEALRLWRERPYARLIDGAIQRGIIDRLVARVDENGAVLDAVVLDFKTDDIPAEAAPERARIYQPQLEAYRTAAAANLGIDLAAVSAMLLFVACGEVVHLTDGH